MKKILVFSALYFFSFLMLANAGVKTQEIIYKYNNSKLKGFLAFDDSNLGKRPGILVVHEWWGHNNHARNRAKQQRRFYSLGFCNAASNDCSDHSLRERIHVHILTEFL